MNLHCGKHDKIFEEGKTCPGCDTDKLAASSQVPSSTQTTTGEKESASAQTPALFGADSHGRPVRVK